MNEIQRRDYLSRMGYEVFYPRYKLPGARPSPRYEIPLADINSTEPENRALEQPAQIKPDHINKLAKSPAQMVPEVPTTASDPVPVQAGSAAETTPPIVVPAVAAQSAEELRFSLQFFAINKDLAILNEAPHQQRGKQSRDSLALLQAILCALLPDLEISELSPVEFDWPIAEGLAAAEPKRAATLALEGFLNQRHEQDGFANLLVFAAQIQELLVVDQAAADKAEAQKKADYFGEQQSEKLHSALTVTHSLQSMLVHPLLKRETWMHLQSLRRRLQS